MPQFENLLTDLFFFFEKLVKYVRIPDIYYMDSVYDYCLVESHIHFLFQMSILSITVE